MQNSSIKEHLSGKAISVQCIPLSEVLEAFAQYIVERQGVPEKLREIREWLCDFENFPVSYGDANRTLIDMDVLFDFFGDADREEGLDLVFTQEQMDDDDFGMHETWQDEVLPGFFNNWPEGVYVDLES